MREKHNSGEPAAVIPMRGASSSRSTRAVKLITGIISRLPVARHPALFISPGLEGYRHFVFGCRAGPHLSASHALHEMGHAAEFGPEKFSTRAHSHGFEFRVPRRFAFGRFFEEPVTFKGGERELRTFACQYHLAVRCGYRRMTPEGYARYQVSAMRFMPDWLHVPGLDDQQRMAHCAMRVQQLIEQYTSHEVVDRLEGWLDMTREHLAGTKTDPEFIRKEARPLACPVFRATGEPVAMAA